MKILRIKDNTSVSNEECGKLPHLTSELANKTLAQLAEEGVFVFPEVIDEAEDIEGKQFVLESDGTNLRAGNVMGFLGCDDERLVITSRFASGENDFFLQYLLSKVLELPSVVDLRTDANQDNLLLNFLMFLFPHYLKLAMRKGPYKKYTRREYNDSNVKGAFNIPRHIKLNTPFVGKIAYSQREFSCDNELMELVRHTIEFIKRKQFGSKLLYRAKNEVELVIGLTPSFKSCDAQKIINSNKKNMVRHAFYKEYGALQRLCLMILQQQKHQIGTGSRQIYGILFDGAWLWEEYINLLIGDTFFHPRNKARKTADKHPQQLFTSTTEQGVIDKKQGLIYPDFISKNAENRLIADAKYKPVNNIGDRDYLQMLAYMYRFESKCGYFIYPEANGEAAKVLRLNRGSTFENNVGARDDVLVTKLGLRIPHDAESYQEFAEAMRESEEELVRRMGGE
ncbi:MAG: hypothetical protein Q3982_04085 [Phoenicibacter congonensis]|uniref:5-methylcytosine-specific restriction enzyme subunit McrC n=1 Tax=Phoenicibacter congonensis TaxID=1944646 RepID=A0AA43RHC3_9ACTN|nr:hypothetical protein [Phoenicibacter congonensis]